METSNFPSKLRLVSNQSRNDADASFYKIYARTKITKDEVDKYVSRQPPMVCIFYEDLGYGGQFLSLHSEFPTIVSAYSFSGLQIEDGIVEINYENFEEELGHVWLNSSFHVSSLTDSYPYVGAIGDADGDLMHIGSIIDLVLTYNILKQRRSFMLIDPHYAKKRTIEIFQSYLRLAGKNLESITNVVFYLHFSTRVIVSHPPGIVNDLVLDPKDKNLPLSPELQEATFQDHDQFAARMRDELKELKELITRYLEKLD